MVGAAPEIPVTSDSDSAPETSWETGGSKFAAMASPPKSFTLYCSGRKTSHCRRLMGTSIFGREISEPPFFANGAPEWMKTKETLYESVGRKPGRNRGTRLPSGPSTGFTFSPATSAVRMLASAGSAIFKNGWAWFFGGELDGSGAID